MAESEDVNLLKRRGRRRLVGAIALVLAAVIVLPMVFDPEPRGSAPPVNVRIPGEDDTSFVPKVTAKKALEKSKPGAEAIAKAAEMAPEKAPEKAEEKAAEAPAEKAAPAAPETPAEKPAPKIEVVVKKAAAKPAPPQAPAKAEVVKAEAAKAEAALAGEQFIVPAGAYVDPGSVIDRLRAAKIPFYTEPIATKTGTVTRVRAGPFASREAADRVLQQLKDLGLKPGNVAPKS
jgi:DedD protein